MGGSAAKNMPTEQIMGAVIDGYAPPKRAELGDLDQAQWEVDDKGRRRDPWHFSNYLILVGDDDALYTFATRSKGGLGAIGELCKSYGKAMRQQPDKFPVIELGVGSYLHRDRTLGRIKYPVLKVVDLVPAGPFLRLLAEADDDSRRPKPRPRRRRNPRLQRRRPPRPRPRRAPLKICASEMKSAMTVEDTGHIASAFLADMFGSSTAEDVFLFVVA